MANDSEVVKRRGVSREVLEEAIHGAAEKQREWEHTKRERLLRVEPVQP
jgi:hypothetical protein